MKLIKTSAKQIFTRTKIPGVSWVLNQYVGCEHACGYCYAKFMCRWKSHGAWGNWVEAKMNAPELVKGKLVTGSVFMSSISDAYQPIEKKLELTRAVLENMDKRTELEVLTKSDLILRDIDLFNQFSSINLGLTLNGFDAKTKKAIESDTPKHDRRVNALQKLKNAGLKTYGFISPVIPGLVDIQSIISETRNFVDYYIIEFLNMSASGPKFRQYLKTKHPIEFEKTKNKEALLQQAKKIKQLDSKISTVVLHPWTLV
ncbi:MAG: radical SAM protein [Candidatus Altiarchaeota archaeon]|nr:radical SAM protein [Candidatus Altiarchaeota archaeon]